MATPIYLHIKGPVVPWFLAAQVAFCKSEERKKDLKKFSLCRELVLLIVSS